LGVTTEESSTTNRHTIGKTALASRLYGLFGEKPQCSAPDDLLEQFEVFSIDID
jgi:hypothetical protein